MAREATPALTCISVVADRLAAGVEDLAIEDRRYGSDGAPAAALRTFTVLSGRGQAMVLNGNASRSTYYGVDVRLSSPLNGLYSAWSVPATVESPDRIAEAILVFCDVGSPGWSKDDVEAGVDAAAEILEALGAARLGR